MELCQLEDDKTLLISRAAPYSLRLVTSPAPLAFPRPRRRTIISSPHSSPPYRPSSHSRIQPDIPQIRGTHLLLSRNPGVLQKGRTLREFSLGRDTIPAGNKEKLREAIVVTYNLYKTYYIFRITYIMDVICGSSACKLFAIIIFCIVFVFRLEVSRTVFCILI